MVDDLPQEEFRKHFVSRSKMLAVALDGDTGSVVATASLKLLSRESSRILMRKAGLFYIWLLQDCPCLCELGYLATLPTDRRRGHGVNVCAELLRSEGRRPVYATAHEDNKGVQLLLRKLEFIRIGMPWDSRSSEGSSLHLYVRAART